MDYPDLDPFLTIGEDGNAESVDDSKRYQEEPVDRSSGRPATLHQHNRFIDMENITLEAAMGTSDVTGKQTT